MIVPIVFITLLLLLWGFIMFTEPHPIFHDWKWVRSEVVVEPKCGPYDPRNEERRRSYASFYVCCKCGKEKRL